MSKQEYTKLVALYGADKATRAKDWFYANHNAAFRAAVRAADYCVTNEYLWF